jgi:hypothetical protein
MDLLGQRDVMRLEPCCPLARITEAAKWWSRWVRLIRPRELS